MVNPVYEKILKCYESYKAKIDFTPKVALILGSGLGDFASTIKVVDTLDYHDIEGFPVSTVPGHAGRFIFGYVGGDSCSMYAGACTLLRRLCNVRCGTSGSTYENDGSRDFIFVRQQQV